MPISEQARQMIAAETEALNSVLDNLSAQAKERTKRLQVENKTARELTSSLVQARREEDILALSSAETLAHGLKDQHSAELDTINRLLKNPYFARMVLHEEAPNQGGRREIEYKIGLAENAACRIIDWRKAPIAKLYYEYREDDEYSEEIQGRERSGKIVLRNLVDTQGAKLKEITCRYGRFVFKNGEWLPLSASGPAGEAYAKAPPEPQEGLHLLPQIAALLDPLQFRLIAENAGRAMLIYGIAGSGKTSVGLHRLAWLLAGESKILPERCLILVLSNSFKTYISRTLPALGVEGVRVLRINEWLSQILSYGLPHLCREGKGLAGTEELIHRPAEPIPAGIARLKRSLALLKAVEEFVQEKKAELQSALAEEILLNVLADPVRIKKNDETNLIDEDLIKSAEKWTAQNLRQKALDCCDDALLVRILCLLRGGVYLPNGALGKYDHIMADEVQDFSPVDLACILGAVTANGITLVGDADQKIGGESTFSAWEKLHRYWTFKDSLPHYVGLNLSYRSTAEILSLADYIQQKPSAQNRAGRHGRVPIWFKCLSEERCLQAAKQWLNQALEKYPTAMTAVICADPTQAKHILSLLKPSFGPLIRPGDESSFSFEGGIVVTHISQVRGLEFTNVLIWNPSKQNFPADATHRNLLYLAVTRAKENLCLVSWGKSSDLLPSLYSPLLRGYDIASEELEAQSRGE